MARTTLAQTTKTNVSSWSSGPIAIAALNEVIIDIAYTAISGGTVTDNTANAPIVIQVSRVTPFGRLVPLGTSQIYYSFTNHVPFFPGAIAGVMSDSIDLDHGFAQSIQADIINNSNNMIVSFDISMVGN